MDLSPDDLSRYQALFTPLNQAGLDPARMIETVARSAVSPSIYGRTERNAEAIAEILITDAASVAALPEDIRAILATVPGINDNDWFTETATSEVITTAPANLDEDEIALLRTQLTAHIQSIQEIGLPDEKSAGIFALINHAAANGPADKLAAAPEIAVIAQGMAFKNNGAGLAYDATTGALDQDSTQYVQGPVAMFQIGIAHFADDITARIFDGKTKLEDFPPAQLDLLKAAGNFDAMPAGTADPMAYLRQQVNARLKAAVPENGALDQNLHHLYNLYALSGLTATQNPLLAYSSYPIRPLLAARASLLQSEDYNSIPEAQRGVLESMIPDLLSMRQTLREPAPVQPTPAQPDPTQPDPPVQPTDTAGGQTTPPAQTAEPPEDDNHVLTQRILTNAATVMGLDPRLAQEITDPRRLDALQTAHFQAGYESAMARIFEEHKGFIYGRPEPTANNPDNRIGGHDSLWIYAFENNQTYFLDSSGAFTLNGRNSGYDLSTPNRLSGEFLKDLRRIKAEEYEINFGHQWADNGNFPPLTELETQKQAAQTDLRALLANTYEGLDVDTMIALAGSDRAGFMEQLSTAPLKPGESHSAFHIESALNRIAALDDLAEITAMHDYTLYAAHGLVRQNDGVYDDITPLNTTEPWRVNWDNAYGNFHQFDWNSAEASHFRVFEPEIYHAIRHGDLNTDMFREDAHATRYIEAKGWSGPMRDDQAAELAQALMLRQSAERHGIANAESPEAKAAFLQDIRDGYYNWTDVEFSMRAADADQAGHQAARDNRAASMPHMEAEIAANPDFWLEGADIEFRAAAFNDRFGQDVTIRGANGNAISVENATLTQDQAVAFFWRFGGQSLGYSQPDFNMSYDELLAKHGDVFAGKIKDIMENVSLYQYYMVPDGSDPAGDFRSEFIRNFKIRTEEQLEEEFKIENGVIEDPASRPVQTPIQLGSLETDNGGTGGGVTPQTLRAAADEITVPPTDLADASGSFAPSASLRPLVRPTA